MEDGTVVSKGDYRKGLQQGETVEAFLTNRGRPPGAACAAVKSLMLQPESDGEKFGGQYSAPPKGESFQDAAVSLISQFPSLEELHLHQVLSAVVSNGEMLSKNFEYISNEYNDYPSACRYSAGTSKIQ